MGRERFVIVVLFLLAIGRRGAQCDLTHIPPCPVLQVSGAGQHWYAMGTYKHKPMKNEKAMLFENINPNKNRKYTKYQIKVQSNGKIVLRSRNRYRNKKKKSKKWSQLIKGKNCL